MTSLPMPPKPLAEQLVALSQEAWTPTHAGCETKYRQLLTKCQQLVAAVELLQAEMVKARAFIEMGFEAEFAVEKACDALAPLQ